MKIFYLTEIFIFGSYAELRINSSNCSDDVTILLEFKK